VTSGHTAFWLQAENNDHSKLIDTGTEWQVRVDRSRSVEPGMPQLARALNSVFYARPGRQKHSMQRCKPMTGLSESLTLRDGVRR
jgi:hypothetical protein